MGRAEGEARSGCGNLWGMGGLIVKATMQGHNQKGVLCRCAGAVCGV